MATKMVANFRRSVSFPNHPSCSSPSSSSLPSSKRKKAYHVRSASVPCRSSHPLISQLQEAINELKSSWASKEPDARNSAWLCDGLAWLKTVQESLDDLLQLPQARESLDRWQIEKFLDDFLRFLDVYGIFQTLILTLKEQHSAARVAARRRDESKMSLHLKKLGKLAKELGQLASSLQPMVKSPSSGTCPSPLREEDGEISRVVEGVIGITAAVSVALFTGLSVSLASRRPSCLNFGLGAATMTGHQGIQEFEEMVSLESLRKKDGEESRMQELEDCICGIETGSERVFRSLFNTRVALLNVLTHL